VDAISRKQLADLQIKSWSDYETGSRHRFPHLVPSEGASLTGTASSLLVG